MERMKRVDVVRHLSAMVLYIMESEEKHFLAYAHEMGVEADGAGVDQPELIQMLQSDEDHVYASAWRLRHMRAVNTDEMARNVSADMDRVIDYLIESEEDSFLEWLDDRGIAACGRDFRELSELDEAELSCDATALRAELVESDHVYASAWLMREMLVNYTLDLRQNIHGWQCWMDKADKADLALAA